MPETTIQELKRLLAQGFGVPVENQRLIYSVFVQTVTENPGTYAFYHREERTSIELPSDDKKLQDYITKIQPNDYLALVLRSPEKKTQE